MFVKVSKPDFLPIETQKIVFNKLVFALSISHKISNVNVSFHSVLKIDLRNTFSISNEIKVYRIFQSKIAIR